MPACHGMPKRHALSSLNCRPICTVTIHYELRCVVLYCINPRLPMFYFKPETLQQYFRMSNQHDLLTVQYTNWSHIASRCPGCWTGYKSEWRRQNEQCLQWYLVARSKSIIYMLEISTGKLIYLGYETIENATLLGQQCWMQDVGHKTSSNDISACRQVNNRMPTATQMFIGSNVTNENPQNLKYRNWTFIM